MVTKDLSKYAKENWKDYKETISKISKGGRDGNQKPLVVSTKKQYNFDEICLDIFGEGKVPTSADGIVTTKKGIELTEFKSGFKRKITKENFDPETGCCPKAGEVCEDYWELFFKEQKKEISELIQSIRLKAIESYITLEKHIFPHCQDAGTRISIALIVVIDGDEVDTMEDTLSELADIEPGDEENHLGAVRNALKRLNCQCDANGSEYYYDKITVMSVQDYKNQLRLH